MRSAVQRFSVLIIIAFTAVATAYLTQTNSRIEATHKLEDSPSLQTANRLSTAFREVSNHLLPSVVTIKTVQKVESLQGSARSPFEEFFKNDPRFEEFFGDIKPRFENGTPRQRRSIGQGAGFVVNADGYIVTNAHVVDDAEKILVRFHDGQEAYSTMVKIDQRSDVAILKVDGIKNLKSISFGDSNKTEVGDWVLAIGNPFGLDISVSAGIISGKGRAPNINEREDYLQTDAAVNPGNSGGPLVNLKGQVVGINTAISSRSGGYDGVAFAIPSNLARWVVEELIENGAVERSYLGVGISPVSQSIARQFGGETNVGALIENVGANSPAEKAGLLTGDIILSVDGKEVTSTLGLQGLVERLKPGESYDVVILREGAKKTVSVKMEKMPGDFTLARKMLNKPKLEKEEALPNDSQTLSDEKLGLTLTEISPEISKQLDLSVSQGVLVTAVTERGVAETMGVKSGDVVVKLGSHKIKSLEDYEQAMKKLETSREIVLGLKSGKSTKILVLRPQF